MLRSRPALWLAIPFFLACSFCTLAQEPSQTDSPEQDVAEAARQAKLKKQQKPSDPANSTKPAAKSKSKTYTNDDIPESKAAATTSSSQDAKASDAPAAKAPDSDTNAASAAKDSAEVTVSPTRSSTPHPGGSGVNWSVHNTSDHVFDVTLTLIVTGPCKYRYENSRSTTLTPGVVLTDNMFGFPVYENSCPGTYDIELRAISHGQVLATATSTITVT